MVKLEIHHLWGKKERTSETFLRWLVVNVREGSKRKNKSSREKRGGGGGGEEPQK